MQMNELLPCPFCGGEAEMLTAESMNGGYLFGIMCNDCRSRGDVYDTEAEAIAAWNSRADYHGYEQAAIEAWENIKKWNTRSAGTCNYVIEDNMNETEGMGDVWFRCTNCNMTFDYLADDWLMKMNYCPNCGARKVNK